MTDTETHLEELASKHYENFPVGSFAMPARFRRPIRLIYSFARVADDIADEGNEPAADRIQRLNIWSDLLHRSLEESTEYAVLNELAVEIQKRKLPVRLFDDLMIAFRKDCENHLYQSYEEVLEYCTYSANPIGKLLLHIFHCFNEENERFSDDICTALQLTNFWQDISIDTRRNRFYIARNEFEQFGFSIADLQRNTRKKEFVDFMKYKIEWTKGLFESGKPLIRNVPLVFRLELKLIWNGGMRILEKIEESGYDTRAFRPVVGRKDKLSIFFKALRT